MQFDVAVIGGGPGGYVAAIRAAQLGKKVALIEKESRLGGTCLRVGCIPSKALLESSEHYWQASKHFEDHGIKLDGYSIDLKTMLGRKDKIVDELTSGVGMLMKKNKVEVFEGWGKLVSANKISISLKSGESKEIEASNIILAMGSDVIELPHVPFDGEHVVSSTEALSFDKVPKHLVVIGAGAVGLEMGSVWARLGAKVTVVELLNRITPFADAYMSRLLMKSLQGQGLEFMLETKMTAAEVKDGEVHVTVEKKDGSTETLAADKMLVSVGRRAFSKGCGLEDVGVNVAPNGKVIINIAFQTNIPNIYAIGDLVDGPMLAHKAEEEGVAVAELIAGEPGHVNYIAIPNIVYTDPELAMVGLTEEECKEKGIPVKTGRFNYRSNGRAKTMGATEGAVKVIAHKETDRLLGVHIVGTRASELIGEAVVGIEFGASAEDLARTSHAHPTLSEILKEAYLAVDKRTING